MTLGPLIVVTDRRQAEAAGRTLTDTVDAVVEAGARTVLLREKDLDAGERLPLAQDLAQRVQAVDGSFVVAGDAGLARAVLAAGVHLAADDPWPPITSVGNRRLLVGRSCHSIDELRAAADEGIDYATLSPIWETASKPGYGPALGVDALASACAAVPDLPVYALGGVTPDRASACREAGASGAAVMGEIMSAGDPASAVRRLVVELADGR